jgi:hypothetical protein
MQDQYWNECLKLVVDKFNYGNPEEWTHKTYEYISEHISQETNITISTFTLKRILGKQKTKENYDPQVSTRNALAQYIGYNDWLHFTKKHNLRSTKKHRLIYYVVPVLVVCLLIVVRYDFDKSHIKTVESNITDSSKHVSFCPLIGLAPLEVEINNMSNDTLKIDWDEPGYFIKLLPRQKKSVKHTYPDVYLQKIFDGDKTVQKTTIIAQTDGWETYLITDDNYYEINKATKSYLSVKAASIPSNLNAFWTDLTKIDTFNIDGNNFLFECILKNDTSIHNLPFYDCIIFIHCTKGDFRLHFVDDKNGDWIKIVVSENEHKMSDFYMVENFSKAITTWNNVKLHVKRKRASVFLNSNHIFTSAYNEDIGDVAGIRFIFKGVGAVNNVKLSDLDEEKVFLFDRFDK